MKNPCVWIQIEIPRGVFWATISGFVGQRIHVGRQGAHLKPLKAVKSEQPKFHDFFISTMKPALWCSGIADGLRPDASRGSTPPDIKNKIFISTMKTELATICW